MIYRTKEVKTEEINLPKVYNLIKQSEGVRSKLECTKGAIGIVDSTYPFAMFDSIDNGNGFYMITSKEEFTPARLGLVADAGQEIILLTEKVAKNGNISLRNHGKEAVTAEVLSGMVGANTLLVEEVEVSEKYSSYGDVKVYMFTPYVSENEVAVDTEPTNEEEEVAAA